MALNFWFRFFVLLTLLGAGNVFAQTKPVAPLFFAEGISQVADLDAYKRAGLNTVTIRLGWKPSQNGFLDGDDFRPAKELGREAAKRGLQIIYILPAAPTGFERSIRISEDSAAYTNLWETWAQGAIAALDDTPNLLGWRLPDDPRGLSIFDDTGFARWVARNYATVEVLNRQWGTRYQSLGDVSINDVGALAARWKAFGDSDELLSSEELREKMRGGEIEAAQRLAFHPASLALAAYKWDAYRALVTFWVGVVRGANLGNKLVFSGSLPDYAQLLSQPLGVDVICPNIAPGVAENDLASHNPQAIDIARRGGKFATLPIFSARESAILPKEALAALVPRWMGVANARGARGCGFDSWDALKNDLGLLTAVTDTLQRLRAREFATLWGTPPTATTAVLLTPLAQGTTISIGEFGQTKQRGLYGFGEDLASGEPSNLVWSLKWGTAFGSVDYLSPDDLDGSLDAYTTILAPQLLSCPLETTQSLGTYVHRGGVLVADLGLGALQNGGQVNAIPPAMAQLFGVSPALDIRPISFNLRGASPHPLLPTWSRLMEMRKEISLTGGEAPGGAAFAGPVGWTMLNGGAQIVALGGQMPVPVGRATPMLRTGVTINRAGSGYAIWAPFRMWQFWRPGHAGFDGFHGDLLARGAALAIPIDAVVPLPANAPEGQTRFPEIVNRPDSVTFLNHDAPGIGDKLASLQTSSAGDWLWRGGLAYFGAPGATLNGARPAPIPAPNPYQATARAITLFGKVLNGQSQTLSLVPISAQNLQGGPLCASVLSWEKTGVEISLWPNASTVVPANDEWQPAVGIASPLRLTVYSRDDGYSFVPGSKHRALISDLARVDRKGKPQTAEKIVVAGASGELVLEVAGVSVNVKISPVVGK